MIQSNLLSPYNLVITDHHYRKWIISNFFKERSMRYQFIIWNTANKLTFRWFFLFVVQNPCPAFGQPRPDTKIDKAQDWFFLALEYPPSVPVLQPADGSRVRVRGTGLQHRHHHKSHKAASKRTITRLSVQSDCIKYRGYHYGFSTLDYIIWSLVNTN